MNRGELEQCLAELPLYNYFFTEPGKLEYSERVRRVCEYECPQFGQSWACPPGVGSVAECRERCLGYDCCLAIATVTEIGDIGSMDEALATRPAHERITDEAAGILRKLGAEPYILSTQSCAICPRCSVLDGEPCRFPEKMHPCVESHGINLIPTLEEHGMEFQYGQNVVTWISLLLFRE